MYVPLVSAEEAERCDFENDNAVLACFALICGTNMNLITSLYPPI